MSNAILYQAYGGNDFINECRYSLLKYLQVYNLNVPASTAIVIYTDQPHLFSDFTPFFRQLMLKQVSKETIMAWKGTQNFVHRFKIEMIIDWMNEFTGSILYCDTDTYITQPIEPIFDDIENGKFYMHENEGVLNKKISPSFHKWEDFLSAASIKYGNKNFEFSNELKLFNAGVVGLHSNNKEVLDNVLSLTDAIYQQFPKHIAEQFAFCYCLQQNGEVNSADYAISHYWNLKEFRQLLAAFFLKNQEESIPNLVKEVHHIDALAIQQQKNSFKRLTFLQRFIKTLSGSAWRISQYEKKL